LAARRQYDHADRWSKEIKERRTNTLAFAHELQRELSGTERTAVTNEDYPTAHACQLAAAT